MQVNYKTTNYNQNFKATYPVVHWVAESNGSFAPVANLELTRKLQGKIIRILNKSLLSSTKPMNPSEQKLRTYISSCDVDYRQKPIVRSFYDRIGASFQKFNPTAYMISGNNVNEFNELLAKKIGKAKKVAKSDFSTPYSPEAIKAIQDYNFYGLQFVNSNQMRIRDKNNMTYVLHTKFEIIRNKLGKIKDYKFVDVRFLPERGKANPFERM